MYIFADTEFCSFENMELISVGLISEDGKHEFYTEINDYDWTFESMWVKENVLPLLDRNKYGKPYKQTCQDLIKWLNSLPSEHKIIVVDYVGDYQLIFNMIKNDISMQGSCRKPVTFELLNPSFDNMLSERGYSGIDQDRVNYLRSMTLGIETYFVDIDNRQHHALVDARANRYGWLQGIKKAEKK